MPNRAHAHRTSPHNAAGDLGDGAMSGRTRARLRTLPPATLALMAAICVGYFVDSAIYLLLLLSSSRQPESWWVTAVVLANLLPPLALASVLGWVVDRVSGRRAWTLALALSAVCASGIAFVDSAPALVALAVVQSVCSVVVSAAVFKVLPQARGLDERSASSFAVGIGSVAAVGAPPLAALAAGAGIDVAFWICGGLLTAAACVVYLACPREVQASVERTAWHEVWLGTRTVRTMAVLRVFVPVTLGVVVAASMEGVAGVFYLQDVAGSALGYALLLSAWAAGSFLGAVLTGRAWFTLRPVACIQLGGLALSLAILVEGLVPVAPVIAVAFLAGGLGNAVHNVGVRQLVYAEVPRAQQAQVWAVVGAAFSGAGAIGNFIGTPGLIGPARVVIVLAGALGATLVLVTMGWMRLQPGAAPAVGVPEASSEPAGEEELVTEPG